MGSSESTHVKMPHCWKPRVVAHLIVLNLIVLLILLMTGALAWADPERGGRGSDPPHEKSQKGFLSKASQSYKASIQCWAIISSPAKRHLNSVSLAGR